MSSASGRPAPDDRLVAAITAAVQAFLTQEVAQLPTAQGSRLGRAWKVAARNPSFESPTMRALSWKGR